MSVTLTDEMASELAFYIYEQTLDDIPVAMEAFVSKCSDYNEIHSLYDFVHDADYSYANIIVKWAIALNNTWEEHFASVLDEIIDEAREDNIVPPVDLSVVDTKLLMEELAKRIDA